MKTRAAAVAAVTISLLLVGGRAAAWDAATTHAGLTQRSALSSRLHAALSSRLGRPLGLFQPIALHPELMDEARRQALLWQLASFDAEGGFRPDANGVSSALGWLTAGTVLAELPERARHTFFDPTTGLGLRQDRNLAGLLFALREVPDTTGTVRQLATGSAFDLTGRAATEWVRAADNELGVRAFHDQLEAAVTAVDVAARDHALARALMALGGVLAVLEDMGDPAHVRNDFRGAYLNAGGPSLWDRSSAFELAVTAQYGRAGVPQAAAPVVRPTLLAYFTDPDGQGLADRTARLFFSDGTVPAEVLVTPDSRPDEVLRAVRGSLLYPSPTISRVDLTRRDRIRHMVVNGRRVLAYALTGERLRFFLDEVVYSDTAKAQLPEVGAYGAGLIDHLLGPQLQLSLEDGKAEVKAGQGVTLPAAARLRIVGEDASGARRELFAGDVSPLQRQGGVLASASVPAGIRRVAVTLRGESAGETVLGVAEAQVSPPSPAPRGPAEAPAEAPSP